MGGPPSQDAARAAYAEAFTAARAAGDAEGMAAAALGLASLQRFGGPEGRAPALLHEALAAADDRATRVRLAAALARAWVYGNDARRGTPFARDAVALAEALGDPVLLADALDAQLSTSWGPGDLAERLHIAARLQDVAAHLDVVRTRLDATMWRLTTALETLDVVGVQRQLGALDLLATETADPVVRYFAVTRRAMHAILTDRLDLAEELIATAEPIGAEAQIPDAYAIRHTLVAEVARHRGDVATLRAEVPLFDEYAVEHGIQSLSAEAAVLWLEAGDRERAERLVLQSVGAGFDTVPMDVDWLLTLTKSVEAAAALGLVDMARAGVEMLAPYAGRAVVNAGAVVCAGVVDDYLHLAAVAVGDRRAEDWRASAAAAYRRLDAPWWLDRVEGGRAPVLAPAQAPGRSRRIHLHPVHGGAVWAVGPEGAEKIVADMRGLHYLRALLSRPGVDVTALELVAMAAGHGVVVDEAAVGETVDRRALQSYKQRLAEIDAELDEAQAWSDPARVERLEAEREALLAEVGRAAGLGGRVRLGAGSAERARVAVRKAITAALDRIAEQDPATARLLRATVRTGQACRYEPDPDSDVVWRLTGAEPHLRVSTK